MSGLGGPATRLPAGLSQQTGMARPSLHLCTLYRQRAEPQTGPDAPSARSSAGRQGYLWEYDGHLRPSRAKARWPHQTGRQAAAR